MKFIYIVTADFVDGGERVSSTAAIKEGDGKSYAIARFLNGKLSDHCLTDGVNAKKFLKESARLLENSIPQRFIHTL